MREICARAQAELIDGMMCLMLNRLQPRGKSEAIQPLDLERYVTQCNGLTLEQFYALEPMQEIRETRGILRWRSPVKTTFPENATARASLFVSPDGWSAPTVVFLHALMSASDLGYRRIARRFNEIGWNAVFPHLPFHYSRVPRGHFNGSLALTANLPRNGETLRQAVKEMRQLVNYCRARGSRRFGIIATSYGGWIGALLSFVEADLEFITLLQPIADVEQAIWDSPAGRAIRAQLMKAGVARGISLRHAHLSSPLHGKPLIDPSKITLIAGAYDRVVPVQTIERLAEVWGGLPVTVVPQGHFGYRAMRVALDRLFAAANSDPVRLASSRGNRIANSR
jgi:pimeloyl-ACP methyl ester carboxylesterase